MLCVGPEPAEFRAVSCLSPLCLSPRHPGRTVQGSEQGYSVPSDSRIMSRGRMERTRKHSSFARDRAEFAGAETRQYLAGLLNFLGWGAPLQGAAEGTAELSLDISPEDSDVRWLFTLGVDSPWLLTEDSISARRVSAADSCRCSSRFCRVSL